MIADDAPAPEATEPADRLHVAAAALLIRAAQIDGTVDAHEQQLLQHPKGRTFAIANTSLEELYKNINIGYKKTLTRSEVNKSIKF
ncbi:MAG: TerB family tellurite resistance protein, partial [Pseudomonadota bacterium]|nr:TerB family tellurite resistance protein [Pseudomonadota bacterium]